MAGTKEAHQLIVDGAAKLLSQLSAQDLECQNTLSHFEIPNISALHTEHVVELRKNSEAFADFRGALRQSLRQAHAP